MRTTLFTVCLLVLAGQPFVFAQGGAVSRVTKTTQTITQISEKTAMELLPACAAMQIPCSGIALQNLSTAGLEHALQQQLQQQLALARQANNRLNNVAVSDLPTLSTQAVAELEAANLYPQYPFLDSSKKIADFITIRNNYLFTLDVKRMQLWKKDMDSLYPRLQAQAAALKQPAKGQEAAWLAAQIPADVTDLFLGEEHNAVSVQKGVQNFITALRRQHPGREIFLFTEFLPAGTVWTETTRAKKLPSHLRQQGYIELWQAAVEQDISVIGLEPEYAVRVSCTAFQQGANGTEKANLWSTYEGVRLRNESWQQTIQTYRNEHPEALFVVYTGAAHSLYHQLFSLAKNLPQGKSFVVGLSFRKNLLNLYYEPANLPQRVLLWQTPQAAQLTGYDAHLQFQ